MTTVEVLRSAKDRIERCGWQQNGGNPNPDGPTCAGDAIFKAGNMDSPVYWPAQQLFVRTVVGDRKDILNALYQWNDSATRTKQEILDAFDAAIKAAEQEAVAD